MQQVAENMWVATGTAVNWMIVRDGSDLTVIDAGWPGDWRLFQASLEEIGACPQDITAVLLTHAHVDHLGALPKLWEAVRTPVEMHPNEVPLAQGHRAEQATALEVIKMSWRPRVAAWGARAVTVGGLSHPVLAHARAWQGAHELDLPGQPLPVPCPGHTSGHTAYYFPRHGVIAVGDAFATGHPVTGKSTPHLLPEVFNTSISAALDSLATLAACPADVVVAGHGPVWTGPVDRAAAMAIDDYELTFR